MKTGDIRREFFGEPFPVTTTVQVVCLYDPDLLVEITAMAEIPRELNYENNILLCDSALTTKMRRRQDEYLAQYHEVTAEMVAHWPITRRLWNNAIAMLGPVL